MAEPYIERIYPLTMIPGVQVDGTQFNSRNWVASQWTRFYGNDAMKMGGFQEVANDLPRIPRGIMVVPEGVANDRPIFRVYIGDSDSLYYIEINEFGNKIGGLNDITPVGRAPNINTLWDFDITFDTGDGRSTIVAHGPPNLLSIAQETETPVYYGKADSNDALTPTGFVASGGITCLGEFLFIFGNDGFIQWTKRSDPTTRLGSGRPTGNKIIYGLPIIGSYSNSSPAGLFWSLDCLIKCSAVYDVTNVGALLEFRFESISCQSSVLSSQGIIEYDSVYYWAGVDRFLFYAGTNGTIRELPNDMCLNDFFDNLNIAQRQKVWATKITRWGEIWWHYPRGNSDECNAAIIYNVRINKWYPAAFIPVDEDINVRPGLIMRSDGEFDQTFAYPLWTGNTINPQGNYSLWMHEGRDPNYGGNLYDMLPLVGARLPIQAYVSTGSIAWCAVGPDAQRHSVDRWVYLYRIELDLKQDGAMYVQVIRQKYARSTVTLDVETKNYPFDEDTKKIDMREQAREMRLTFVSDVLGGFFQLGQILMVAKIGDGRQ